MELINFGLPRTGTQSLHAALPILSHTSKHYVKDLDSLDGYSAACELNIDIPIEAAMQKWPDATYIFTYRKIDDWLDSVIRTLPKAQPRWNSFWKLPLTRFKPYFCERFVEACELGIHVVDLTREDQWQQLCGVLRCEIPGVPFPMKDKTK